MRQLTSSELKNELLYNPETGIFTRLTKRGGCNIGSVAGYINKSVGYVMIDVLGRTYYAHRLAWLYIYGEWPKKTVDHININKADNRISNLRDISHSENARNAHIRIHNTSGVTGVYWHKPTKNWLALGFKGGKSFCLGYFCEWFDCVCARKSWESKNLIQ